MTNGGFKENFFSKEFPKPCDMFKMYYLELYKKLSLAIKKDKYALCPIPPGNHRIKNLIINSGTEFPAFFYNKYLMQIEFKKKGLVQGCLECLLNVYPKNERRN